MRRLLPHLLRLTAFAVLVAFLVQPMLFESLLKKVGLALDLQPLLWQSLRGLLMGLFIAALMPWVLVRLRLLPVGQAAA